MANVFVFSVGFVAILFSEFRPIVDLGLLVGVSLFISGIMSIFVITLLAPWLLAIKTEQVPCSLPMPKYNVGIRRVSLDSDSFGKT